jgi:phasin family protein
MENRMTNLTPEQVVSTQRTNVTAFFAIANQALLSFQEVVDLNVQATKSLLAEGEVHSNEVLAGKVPSAFLVGRPGVAEPLIEKVSSYSHHLHRIAENLQGEFLKVVQTQYEEHNRNAQALFEGITKNAPGSEAAIKVLKSAFSAATLTYETLRKATAQVSGSVQSNFNGATNPVNDSPLDATPVSLVAKKS